MTNRDENPDDGRSAPRSRGATAGAAGARWPVRLLELQDALSRPGNDATRRKAREETWLLLRAALTRFLNHHAARFGSVDPEEIRDLCSEKSLELVRRIETRTWDMGARKPDEVVGFLSTVARNGLIDLFRSRGRLIRPEDGLDDPGAIVDRIEATGTDHPEAGAVRRAFASSLRDCAGALADRDRVAWFLRVFYEMPSRDIARHPEVSVKSAHVDVILQRCRKAVRDCMKRKGQDATELPAGTFTELWFAFRAERSAAIEGSDGKD